MYCIGDIHGRDDLLGSLHEQIVEDAKGYEGERHLLYLGDYIDRGRYSRQVIERLSRSPLPGFESIFLKGNHEQAMLDFMEYPEATASWLAFGGRETLQSYGISVSYMPITRELHSLARQLNEVLPDYHRDFMQQGLLSWSAGDYFFAHAGIRPGVPLDGQEPMDLLWIRGEFIESHEDHGAVVVHGHTISDGVEFRTNRIGIDTGAFTSDVLTCLVLEGQQQRLLQTGPDTA